MGADGSRRRAAPWLGIATVVFAAAAIGLTAFLGGGAEHAATAPPREAPAAAKPNDRPRFEPSERLAAEATSPSPAPSGHAAPALPIVGITLTAIVRVESVPESLPNDPKILEAQGKTASLAVVLTRSAPRGAKDVEAVFIAGLNDGTKAKLSGGQFRFAALYPGRGIVRITWTLFGSQQLNREIVLKPGSNTLEVDTERTINIRGKITDTEGSGEVVEPSIEIDGIPMKSPRAGYLTSAQVFSGRLMFDLTAKGYERRREWRTLLPMGRSRNVTSDFELGRGGTVIVRYSGLREDAPTPIAVLLPVGATDADRYPFEKLGFVRCDRSRREAVFEGVPPQERLEARVLADTAVSIPIVKTLPLADPTQPETRTVTFVMEERKPIRGKVVAAGKPIKGAMVRVESINVASATANFLEHCGGLERIAAPILPIARKRVETGPDGAFAIETFDLERPAALVIEAVGHRRYVASVGDAGGYLGSIELVDDPLAAPATAQEPASETASVVFELGELKARALRIQIEGEAKPRPNMAFESGRTAPFDLPAGTFLAKVEVDGAVREMTWNLQDGVVVRLDDGTTTQRPEGTNK